MKTVLLGGASMRVQGCGPLEDKHKIFSAFQDVSLIEVKNFNPQERGRKLSTHTITGLGLGTDIPLLKERWKENHLPMEEG